MIMFCSRIHFLSNPQAWLSLLLIPLLVSGCGKSSNDTIPSDVQEQVDFSDGANLFSAPIPPARPTLPPATVIATVNGSPVTYGEMEREATLMLVNSAKSEQLTPERVQQLRGQYLDDALQNVIVKKLLLGAIDTEQVTADPADIAEQLAVVKDGVPAGSSLPELLAQNGLTEEELTRDLEVSIRVQKLLAAKTADIVVTDEAVQAFYDENPAAFRQPESVLLRHILLTAPTDASPGTREQVRAKALDLRQQLVDGADFAELARAHSDDTPTRDVGGRIGYIRRNMLPAALEETAFNLEPNEISDVIETQLGFHLLRVEEKRAESVVALDETREAIRQQLEQRLRKQALDAYVTELRDQATIEFPQPNP